MYPLRRVFWTCAFVALATPIAGATSLPPLQTCARVMPLGDSITVGVNGGYRNNLYSGLQKIKCGVSYVGTQSDPSARAADQHHEGHSGLTIGNIASEVDAWLAASQPNIILVMIGTNDTAWWSADSAKQIAARHNALVEKIRQARPSAWIFVASIPPQSSLLIQPNKIDRAVLTQELNAVIRKNVEARSALGQPVRFVAVDSVLTTADLYDGIHPTEQAHAKIAEQFLGAIRTALGPQ